MTTSQKHAATATLGWEDRLHSLATTFATPTLIGGAAIMISSLFFSAGFELVARPTDPKQA